METKWIEEIEKFKEVRTNLDRHIKQEEFTNNKWGLCPIQWLIRNAPQETGINKYSDLIVWCGFETGKSLKQKEYKENLIKEIILLNNKYNRPLTINDYKKHNLYNKIDYIWGTLSKMDEELNLNSKIYRTRNLYTNEELLGYIHKYYNEFGCVPTPTLLELTNNEYPSRKTFEKYFGTIQNAVIEAGYEYSKETIKVKFVDKRYSDKDFLIQIIYDYIEKYNHVPTINDINNEHEKELHKSYGKYFGSWNKCLSSLDLDLNSVSQYSDEELENVFMNFVNKYGRVPSTREFNKSGTPSFWCYQNRFGSWNNAVKHYGFEPIDKNSKYYLDDGEVCASRYEFDISKWLKENNISYIRDVNYKDFIDNYKGKMNCDYSIIDENGDVWYIEMAGFLNTDVYEKMSSEEKNYLYKLQYKKKLLKRQGCNYVIISKDDFNNKNFKDIFYFVA